MAQFQLPAVRVVNPTELRAILWRTKPILPLGQGSQYVVARIGPTNEMRTRFPPRLRGAYCRTVHRFSRYCLTIEKVTGLGKGNDDHIIMLK